MSSRNYIGCLKCTFTSLTTALFILLPLLYPGSTAAFEQRDYSPAEFKSAFIFQVIDKVEWSDENQIQTFKIGLVGDAPELLQQLISSSQNRLIKNKGVSIQQVTDPDAMKQYHLLYIMPEFDIPLSLVASRTTRTNTLLVTENTQDKTHTMINLLPQQDGRYRFEINKANIVFEYLKLNPDLLLLGGSEMDVAELLRASSAELDQLKQELLDQREALEQSKQLMLQYQTQYQNAITESERIKERMLNQAKLLEDKNRLIEAKNVSIREKEGELLAIQNELLKAGSRLESNETILGEKLSAIADKEKQVSFLSELINKNQGILKEQQASIEEQKRQLDLQKQNLEAQGTQIAKQQSWLISAITALMIISIFLIIIAYLNRERRKTNLELVDKNLTLGKIQKELLEARDLAESASHAKSSFLANMSHEIRTPMNAIIGMLHLTKRTKLSVKQSDYISNIDSAAKSLLQIINDILDFSKVEAGELKIEQTEFKMSEVLSDLAHITGLKIQQKGLEFIYDIEPDVPNNFIGDPLRISQILINLTNNAMKFTEAGEVIVKLSATATSYKHVQLSFKVIDSGIGMSPEVAGRLFKPFSQADSSTTRKFGGTGLGLAISKRLVEEMGGSISVFSRASEGSTFRFDLNLEFMPVDNRFDKSCDKISQQHHHIILVVANAKLGEALRSIIQAAGLKVSLAYDYRQAVKVLEHSHSEPVDQIFIDQQIIYANRKEFQKLKQKFSLKVCVLLSSISHDDEKLIQQLYPDLTLHKPVTPLNLLEAIYLVSQDLEEVQNVSLAETSAEDYETGSLSRSFKDLNLLVVEDNQINQKVACEILTPLVNRVDVANDGLEAVQKVSNNYYDCVLMDVQMPVMDGFQSAREIRKTYTQTELPIIAMTANAMDGDKEKCLNAGMNDYVPKPIQVNELFKTIGKWVGLPDSPQDNKLLNADLSVHARTAQIDTESVSIDMTKGTDLMGDSNEYLVLLEQFLEQQSDFASKGEALLSGGNLQSLGGIAHEIKGVSANLFVTILPNTAQALDEACRHEDAQLARQHFLVLVSQLTTLNKLVSDAQNENV